MPNPHGVSWIRHITVALSTVAAAAVAAPAFIAHQMGGDVVSRMGWTRHASAERPAPLWWSGS